MGSCGQIIISIDSQVVLFSTSLFETSLEYVKNVTVENFSSRYTRVLLNQVHESTSQSQFSIRYAGIKFCAGNNFSQNEDVYTGHTNKENIDGSLAKV